VSFEPAPFEVISHNVDETYQIGHHLGTLLRAGDIICLAGDLGAGKTALTRGIGRGWGALEAVTSPTFTLVHEHRRSQDDLTLYHIDCYRLQGSADAWSIGLDDLLHNDGILVIEWAKNIADVLPAERLWIAIDVLNDTHRRLTFGAAGRRFRALVEGLRQELARA
jgi:tRNA threonylcarbamoyladenosine biosynthesis protein TsaE